MMSLHTARVIPEKRFSCPPAAVHFAGVEKEIDMGNINRFEFVVGDFGGVYVSDEDELSMALDSTLCSFEGVEVTAIDENCELVDVGPITPEQAYMLGKALLAAAKARGISD